VFPDATTISLSRAYYEWKSPTELKTWNDTFVPIYQS